MKQYTTPDQTAKLIELGFDRPKSKVGGRVIYEPDADLEIEWDKAYSIGELIEMFGFHLSSIRYLGIEWFVNAKGIARSSTELVDALYAMIVQLKEGGVI